MPNFKCTKCGYLFESDNDPLKCPDCDSKGSVIEVPIESEEAELIKDKQIIIQTFKKFKKDYLKSVKDISQEAGIPSANVLKVMMSFDDFVQSSDRDSSGDLLFTTKEKFRENATFTKKLFGAFKNRID
ncbi:MAG: hypothetical protein RBT19_14075 [Tenuifilaceae bacterium]|jgi:rubredoxin|nr:hypothetical protein [Tenuifilaceae bacterium]